MTKPISRRGFLKAGAIAAAGAAAGAASAPSLARAASGAELCTLLDLEKCIGCGECVSACREQWQSSVPDPVDPIPQPFPKRVPIQDWSGRKGVDDRLTPYNFLYLEHLEIEHKGGSMELNVPRRCMHCTNPPCTNLCPFGAGRVEKNGVVNIDPDVCLGGAKCKKVCPWSIPQRQSGVGVYLDILPTLAGNGVMFKCHRCLPLVQKGIQPRCIEACPEQVQSIGPRAEMLAKAQALAEQKAKADGASQSGWRNYIYGLEENGGTNTLYVSPIPFDAVSRAIEQEHRRLASGGAGGKKGRSGGPGKGGRGRKTGRQGRPHMHQVGNSMESAENLSLALVLAPVAGVAGGLLRLFGGKGGQGQKSQSHQSQGGAS